MKVSRLAAAAAVAGSAVLVLSSPAFAHVTVQPEGTAAKGGYAVVNFRVPNERDNASTTQLEINFPTDTPLSSVLPQQIPGWKIAVTKSKLAKPLEVHGRQVSEAVSKVTWTAEDKGIQPGYMQQFPVSMGALPENADQVVFKAIQTYSNKEVVRWIEVQEKGAEEPENPAPVLELSDASDDHSHGSSAENASEESDDTEAAAATETSDSSGGTDTTARVLGIVGIVVGAAGVAYGVLAGRRRPTAGDAS
ncbi:YcnI family protein [Streptomyces sp. NPDC006527]|uniref:YcnI family copper-binding membrane protein n=1 Tax=Streptomyces sp. NPDC006527 TaxID=3364749 RepID=UPI0036935325